MTKSRPYSKNSASHVLSLFILAFLLSGCSSSTRPSFLKEDIPQAIMDIAKKEYRIDVKVKQAGSTLWVYLPLEDIFEKTNKPEKYLERFEIKDNKTELKGGVFQLTYSIKPIPEQAKVQEFKYRKEATDKINGVWLAIRRALFSMERSRNEPKFIAMVTADILNGFEIQDVFYYQDLKKLSYDFISWNEYQHRTLHETELSPVIIGDKEGSHLNYKDFTIEEFISEQIQNRIKIKFQKPEVQKNADIDKEIIKVVVYTLKTYGFKDFLSVELNNLVTQNRVILNQGAVLARPTD